MPPSQLPPHPRKLALQPCSPSLPLLPAPTPAFCVPILIPSVGAGVSASQSFPSSPQTNTVDILEPLFSWFTEGRNNTSHFEQKKEGSVSQGLVSSKKAGMFGTEGTASFTAEDGKRR